MITDIAELAELVYQTLKARGINATLTGGGVVAIYSRNKYRSRDLDFIAEADVEEINNAMNSIGFKKKGKNYRHPHIEFTVEFPTGPLSIGRERVGEQEEQTVNGRTIRMLSPTNSIKDRLAAYFSWSDRQGLRQAAQLYKDVGGKLDDITRWAHDEGATEKFQDFLEAIRTKESLLAGEYCVHHPLRRLRGTKNKEARLCSECMRKAMTL